MAGRIVLTAGLCFRACPLEGAINPGLSGPGCVSSPLNELILNAAEKKGKCRRERLFNSPSARSPHPVPPRFSIQARRRERGEVCETETVTSDKPTAPRPPRVSFQQDGDSNQTHDLKFHTAFVLSHPSNFSSQPFFYISTREMRHIVKKERGGKKAPLHLKFKCVRF